MLWVPPGLAHGFYTVSEEAEFEYKVTDYYYPQYQRTLKWDDKEVSIMWPFYEYGVLQNQHYQRKIRKGIYLKNV